MSLWIKICGNTSVGDAQLALDAGADAVGLVFAPSPRRVTVPQAAEIVRALPPGIEKIGVFVDAAFEEIEATIAAVGLTGVQLHFDASRELTARLRERFGNELRILRVMHFGPGSGADVDDDPSADAVLVDTKSAKAAGGTGERFDWAIAAATFFQNAQARKRIAAGGLAPENVAEAIQTLQPWGVDVVSGVETAPGRKDAAKVRAFIERARGG